MIHNRISLSILALLLITGTMAHAKTQPNNQQENALQQTLQSLAEGSVLKSKFTQNRHLRDIPHALASSGEIILWAGKGLIWRTKSPFPNSILMTQNGLFQLDNNKKTSLVKEGKMGSDGAILDILSKVLKGSFSDLEGFTTEDMTCPASQWSVRLVPPPAIKKVITSLVIDGKTEGQHRYIKHITIHRPNGDRDEISLEKPQIYGRENCTQALTYLEHELLNND